MGESYFDFIARWLEALPKATIAAQSSGRMRPVRVVAPLLAAQSRNRIRRRADWQPPRWSARHKVTGASTRLIPEFHPAGIRGLLATFHPNCRLILAHSHGDLVRLKATAAFLNARVDGQLSRRCYGMRPKGRRGHTDRGAALRRFRHLVQEKGLCWVAKLDVKGFYDSLPHQSVLAALHTMVPDRGCRREVEIYMASYWDACWPKHPVVPATAVGLPQGSPVSGVLANIYMTTFDKALEDAGIEHIRYVDDVTIVAASSEQLLEHVGAAMRLFNHLALNIAPKKTRIAYLGGGAPATTTVTLPVCGEQVPVHTELDLLGMHFYGDGTFRVRHRTVNRLLSKVQRIIRRDGGAVPDFRRYMRATSELNRMLGYDVVTRRERKGAAPGVKAHRRVRRRPFKRRDAAARLRRVAGRVGTRRPRRPASPPDARAVVRCRINGIRMIQPRQHAILGHSDLILSQMRRVDFLIQRWMKKEFGKLLEASARDAVSWGKVRDRHVRSAAKIFSMAAREPPPSAPPAP